jgi:lysophospholipase L1-like esterase
VEHHVFRTLHGSGAILLLLTCTLFTCPIPLPAQALSGLRVSTNPTTPPTVTVAPGTCRVAGHTVTLPTTTTLNIAPQPGQHIENETYTLAPKHADRWGPGTHLKGCLTTNALPGCLQPDSVSVLFPDDTTATLGTDYELNAQWATIARTPTGRITTDTQVRVSYTVGQMRVDAIGITSAGKVELIPGTPDKATPPMPQVTTGSLHLANVFLPHNATTLQDWQLFPIGAPFAEPTPAELAARAALIPHTLQKLKSGEPVTIVTWGDSVTVGGDASTPAKAYANLFISTLRQRYPKSKITHINASIGGTTTEGRLPAFATEVLAYTPDLVTIEFVNDMPYSEQKLRTNYDNVCSQLRGTGAEIILLTPHFTMLEFMQKAFPRGGETRPAVFTLRSIAAEHHIGLADAAARWAHLDAEGIPYVTYLRNGINHPDDRGHELFVRELMTFFPPAGNSSK